jgi:hypothetical protein
MQYIKCEFKNNLQLAYYASFHHDSSYLYYKLGQIIIQLLILPQFTIFPKLLRITSWTKFEALSYKTAKNV